MANPNGGADDWEAEADQLAQQTQQMNMQQPPPQQGGPPGFSTFTPGAASFQPGAASFMPGQQFGQYGYGQQYGGFPQYGGGGYAQYGQYGGYGQGFPTPAANGTGPAPVKSLSIGAQETGAAPKVEKSAGGTKVMSLGSHRLRQPQQQRRKPQKRVRRPLAPRHPPRRLWRRPVMRAPPLAGAHRHGVWPFDPTPAERKAEARRADLVAQEQAQEVAEEDLEEMYGKEHVNVIFLGTSTPEVNSGCAILYATGMVDERTMDKYKKDAKTLAENLGISHGP
ncbi:hypothetical protein BTJ68_05868 [Hortaea werneckii EXF-2000]|uniref:Uncharacterized protein n=1 Tax=Hortaea werneckii EXF-2000 TaxID=1157616 RepID=A0A1Z5TDG1_HORWE|nr:hypothetical protein BTJ68_05868 [Hortaea werneckii EXF-2000]